MIRLEECFVRRKLLHLFGFAALAAGTLHSQPTNGAVYWSTNSQLDCSSLGETSPTPITNASGATIGYSCYVSGTFLWLAAGGGWGTAIRVAAPASARHRSRLFVLQPEWKQSESGHHVWQQFVSHFQQ